jgi:hypothetical protein
MKNQLETVSFYSDEINYVEKDGLTYIPLKRIAENIGLRWDHELARIKQDEILKGTIPNFGIVGNDGKERDMVCIPFEMLNGYLFTVPITERTRPEIKEKLIQYKKECYKVLHNHFQEKLNNMDEYEKQIWEMEQYIQVIKKQAEQARQVTIIQNQVINHDNRITDIENTLDHTVGYLTVKAFAIQNGYNIPSSQWSSLGKRATALYRKEFKTEPPRIEDPQWGSVNEYPKYILERIFQ